MQQSALDSEGSMDFEMELENAIINSLEEENRISKKGISSPDEVDIFPLTRRPFFPGMAAPIVIEPGPFYDALK